MSNPCGTSIGEDMRGLRLTGLLLPLAVLAGADAADEPAGFSPIAPAPAMHAALQSQWGVVRDWLKDKDYVSAGEAIRGLTTLVHLYGYQADDPAWRKRIADLHDQCGRLAEATQRKSAGDAAQALQECARQLEEMGKNPPTGKKVVDRNYQPAGSVKTWMQLMEGAYVDAKSAKVSKDLEWLAQVLAEEAHAVGYLKPEPRWRESAKEVRDTALKVAKLAQDNQFESAKKTLKEVYQRCEGCHHRYQK